MNTPHLPFPHGTRTATFIRREKRFLVLVNLDGEEVWIHTNNSGSMAGLLRPGREVLISPAANPKRKLPFTLEAIRLDDSPRSWVCVNTSVPNKLLYTAFEQKLLPELAGCTDLKREAVVGNSRLDARFDGPEGTLWVEAKNVTLVEEDVAYFPDAQTVRGQKHLQELMELADQGIRVAMFYCIPRYDAQCFAPADFIDPKYASLFYEALDHGVEAWPWLVDVTPQGLRLTQRLNVRDRLDKTTDPLQGNLC